MNTELELGKNSEVPLGADCYMLDDEQFKHYWPKLSDALDQEPGLWNCEYTKDGIYAAVLSAQIKVWVVSSGDTIHLAFMTRRCLPANEVPVLQVFWIWGNGFIPVISLIDMALDRVAGFLNCGRIEALGRKGFERVLKPLGYEHKYSCFSRPVRAQRGH